MYALPCHQVNAPCPKISMLAYQCLTQVAAFEAEVLSVRQERDEAVSAHKLGQEVKNRLQDALVIT